MSHEKPDVPDRLSAALTDRYRVLREIGEGGMATVFLADDLRHERKVALKVLKPELAAVVGAERFLAEIKTTANLQHPNILPLFDSGEADGFLFYVMPFVEGETLRERIDREKQLPVDEAVRLATAVANALHYAHEHGVVHRDIKPGNILVQAGQPVVGDFGIALAVGSAGGARLTETGLSVGTPYYMSPEQATGDQHVGPSSDIYALAAVLYELLIGDPPYMGSTAQAVLGQIIAGAPISATRKRRSIPAHIDAALRKALEKLPADRFTDATDFARALADPGFRHGEDAAAVGATSPGAWQGVAIGASVMSVVFFGLFMWAVTRPGLPRPVEQFGTPFLEEQQPDAIRAEAFDLSTDGTTLVYRLGQMTAGTVLAVRRWDELSATPIRATEGATYPAISPDGTEVAFSQDGEVKALAFAGGPVRTVMAAAQSPYWGPDGYVYAIGDSGAVRAPAAGGAVERLTRLAEGEEAHEVTDLLPGGDHALVMVVRRVESGFANEIRALDLRSGAMTVIAEGTRPEYLDAGYLVYGTGCLTPDACTTMMAVRFDADAVEAVGAPVAIMDGLAAWAFSDDGKLYYTRGGGLGPGGARYRMLWVSRDGVATAVDSSWTFRRNGDSNQGWALSPDGSMLAIREFTEEGFDIWIKRLDTGPRSRLTFGGSHERMPAWAPDGRTVTYVSDRGDTGLNVWSRPFDGSREAELMVDPQEGVAKVAWSPDGEWLLMRTSGGTQPSAQRDVLGYRPGVDTVPVPLLTGPYREIGPAVSPDGRWLAYASDETGRYEVYVRPFPDVGAARWQLSIDGGLNPQWAHDGDELFFQDTNRRMMSAPIRAGTNFVAGAPQLLFEPAFTWLGSNLTGILYDVAPDDDRFMMAEVVLEDGRDGRPATVLANNFVEIIKERLPR